MHFIIIFYVIKPSYKKPDLAVYHVRTFRTKFVTDIMQHKSKQPTADTITCFHHFVGYLPLAKIKKQKIIMTIQTNPCPALLVAAVRAEDVFPLRNETLVGQTEGASLTVEAVFVPGAALIIHHVHSFTKTCDGVLAAVAFLCHGALVAVHTEDLVLVAGETRPSQRL